MACLSQAETHIYPLDITVRQGLLSACSVVIIIMSIKFTPVLSTVLSVGNGLLHVILTKTLKSRYDYPSKQRRKQLTEGKLTWGVPGPFALPIGLGFF